jgi:predicted phosphodiesterase
MDNKKLIITTDPHGCRDEFQELLIKLNYNRDADRLIVAGDAIDRGTYSQQLIQLLREMNLECVMGNHDLKFLKWYRSQNSRGDVYDRAPHYTQFSDADINYIANMPLYIDIPEHNVVVVHAGLRQGVPLEKQTKDDLCYLRYMDDCGKFVSLKKINKAGSKEAVGAHFWTDNGPFLGGKNIVYGHNVNSMTDIRIDRFNDGSACWGLDTGVAFGGRISALIWDTKEVVQVQAKQVYYQSTFDVR